MKKIFIILLILIGSILISFSSNKTFDENERLNNKTSNENDIPEVPKIDFVEKEIEFETLEKSINYYGDIEEKNYVIISNKEWGKVWNKTYEGSSLNPELPKIDFDSKIIIGAFMGRRSSTGYSIEIKKITLTKKEIIIFIEKRIPTGNVGLVLTYPFHIVKIDKYNKPIKFVENTT